MYPPRFGLRKRPFPATPDSGSYYPATGHEQALTGLLQAIELGEGVLLLTGDAGTGKTLLCHCLLERLPNDATVAFLTNSYAAARKDLLQAILYDLSLPYEVGSEQELRLRLTDFLLDHFSAGKPVLLIIDEAHQLSTDALEELRLLCNLEAGERKAVQVLLVGKSQIVQRIARPELASLQQRLAARSRIEPLDVEEAVDYLLHHVRVAGGKPEKLFTDEGLEALARGTGGVPRLLNQAAHQALLLCEQIGADQVDVEVAYEALLFLGLAAPEPAAETIEEEIPNLESGANVLEEGVEEAEEDVLSCRIFEPKRPA